jgi:hypothetical protein
MPVDRGLPDVNKRGSNDPRVFLRPRHAVEAAKEEDCGTNGHDYRNDANEGEEPHPASPR